MSETPSRRTADEAMRLRPATRADPSTRERRFVELVDALARLHRPLELTAGPICRECLTPHPCRTARLVHPGTEGATPERKESP